MARTRFQASLGGSALRAASVFGRPGRARLLTTAIALLLLSLVAWVSVAWRLEDAMLHPPRASIGADPGASGWAYHDVEFETSDGITLSGWWIPGSRRATVIMVHGQGSSRASSLDRSGYLHQAGYNLLLFDLRAQGLSGGRHSTLGAREHLDVRAAVTLASHLSTGPIALLGYSLGASVAVEEASSDGRVAAVVEDGGFGDLVKLQTSAAHREGSLPTWPFEPAIVLIARLDGGFDMSDIQPASQAARLRQPLLAILGGKDPGLPNQLALYRAARGPKELILFGDSGHVASYDRDRLAYCGAVLGFLDKYLANP